MYLSCLLIDVGTNPDRPRPGRLWLRNRYHVHQRLCMAFPSDERRTADPQFVAPYRTGDFGDWGTGKDGTPVHVPRSVAEGFLFRVDAVPGGRAVIVVQSASEPDWQYAFHNAEHLLAAAPSAREFCPNFPDDQNLRFHLQANATRKIDRAPGPDGKRREGTRVPVRRENLQGWLARKAGDAGFAVESCDIRTGYVHFSKSGDGTMKTRLFSAWFDGLLRVTDPDAFGRAIESGIGPAKAFGFGLLSVAPLRE